CARGGAGYTFSRNRFDVW
nr:immunoglobulin heavy chain junction region [Macaca mulatta]MOV50196.1 immunoglobulin heavy chain junction region [Macaca mulatta]MOV50871.1 immunoglobulin heavy chain junction region [Macaca mulatta]MOV50976.1 immunoglobulin heavy chain junction region [Macaca mulatta]MOV51245.1 immunoglobulin heavy chain junction region [Macaca mulatta]